MELALEYFFPDSVKLSPKVMDLLMKNGLEPKLGKLDAKHMTLY